MSTPCNECEEYQGTGIGWSKRDFTDSLGAMHVAVCDGQIVAHVSHDGGARKRFNKEGIFIESILTNKSHRSKGVTAKMLQYFMASSKTVKKVWFELDPKKYSVEDHPIAKHFLDWTRESEAVTKEKYKKSDYLTDGFTLVSSRGRGRRVKLPSKLSANQQCWG